MFDPKKVYKKLFVKYGKQIRKCKNSKDVAKLINDAVESDAVSGMGLVALTHFLEDAIEEAKRVKTPPVLIAILSDVGAVEMLYVALKQAGEESEIDFKSVSKAIKKEQNI